MSLFGRWKKAGYVRYWQRTLLRSPEELSREIHDMHYDEAVRFLGTRTGEDKDAFAMYAIRGFFACAAIEDKRCRERHGMPANIYYDAVHPA